MDVVGDDLFCALSNNYTVTNLPTGASVQWQATPQGVVTINSPNSAQTTLTKNTDGVVTLNAIISNSCGGQITVPKEGIIVGAPKPVLTAIPLSQPGEPTRIDVFASYKFGSTDPISGVIYHWYLDGSLMPASGNEFIWNIPCNVSSTLECEIVNTCGTSAKASLQETGGCRQRSLSYAVAPNPAVSSVTVSSTNLNSSSATNAFITEVKIFDLQGTLKEYKKFNKVKTAILNVADLRSGTYFIEITDGINKEKQQLIIQK